MTLHGTASELQVAVGECSVCKMYVANSKDRIDMTIRMQKAWDTSVKESKPIVGEGGNRWMGSGKSQLDDPPSPPGLIIKTMLEVRWRRTGIDGAVIKKMCVMRVAV